MKMAVYCPDGKKCSAFSGSNRKCKRIETSKTIPPRFVHHITTDDNFWESLHALVGVVGGAALFSTSENISYEVWECPGCHSEVLYQITKYEEGGTRTEKVAEISSWDHHHIVADKALVQKPTLVFRKYFAKGEDALSCPERHIPAIEKNFHDIELKEVLPLQPQPRHLQARLPERVRVGERLPLQARVALSPALDKSTPFERFLFLQMEPT